MHTNQRFPAYLRLEYRVPRGQHNFNDLVRMQRVS